MSSVVPLEREAAVPAPAPVSVTEPARPMLGHRYMLLTPIPYYVAADGSVWLEQLWHHDFMAHLRYLRRVALVAPRRDKPDRADLIEVETPPGVELAFFPLPHHDSVIEAVLGLPKTVLAMSHAIRNSDLIHSGVAGWPYPLGWVANPLSLLHRKKLIISVESAPWRMTGSNSDGVRRKLRALVTERIAQWSANRADLSFFTQPAYRDSMLTRAGGASVVTPATWIDERDVLEGTQARAAWALKSPQLRVLFAGRLLHDKGVLLLLEAARELERRRVDLAIDIIGDGPLRQECLSAQGSLRNVRVLDPVPYGAPFFALLRDYHAVVVPSISDEQPRIVFDAYSQAVPVIAADTDGLRPNVAPGVTGWLVQRNDAASLADVLARCADAPDHLRDLGLGALAAAGRSTHRRMHELRWQALLEQFGTGPD